ncbi:hypothetical protein D9M73_37610 [compost metagenome]|uniref:Anaerobic ribonucleoside-triphosphate reductase n=1 Tax=Polaromonas aquatica TaxID=332657 RepID=A0ABW1TVZ5_9BURK|nr:anaerobic ribonucleoside-triphosphate reductase [Polaromonas sp.]MDI1341923.1 anaerobic ribonucleoside-triphosphate reductase [Polaromonas sp.]
MITVQKTPTLAPQAVPIVLRDEERQRCEVWTRVMGYHRPVASFNTGKKGEFHERTYFSENNCKSPAAG